MTDHCPWCPFSACDRCQFQGGKAPVEKAADVSVVYATVGNGAAGLASTPRLTPNSATRKRLP